MSTAPRIVVDLSPISSFLGVWRYGISLLRCVLETEWSTEYEWHIIASDDQLLRFRWLPPQSNVRVNRVSSRHGFFRNSEEVVKLLGTLAPAVYWTPDYLGVPHQECVQSLTVHDAFRIIRPRLGYSDEQFVCRFGSAEFARLAAVASTATAISKCDTTFSIALRALQEAAIGRAMAVCTPSTATRDELAGLFPAFKGRVRVVRAGCDLRWFAPATMSITLNMLPKRFLLSVLGDSRVHKGEDRLLSAFVRSGLAKGDCGLVCVGTVRQALPDGVYAFQSVSDAVLGALYRGCAAVVVASDAEGFCLPACEAMAHGKRVVAPDCAELRESTFGRACFYEVGSVVGLAGSMREALALPAIETGRIDCGWAAGVRAFESMLRDLLKID